MSYNIVYAFLVVVYFCDKYCVDKIERDDNFWSNTMEMMLSEFYLKHMVPKVC
jgi:putative lipase involved disintegration of autophagic bodies